MDTPASLSICGCHGGGFPRRPEAAWQRAAQRAVYHVEHALERAALEEGGASVVLCDRGTLDGEATRVAARIEEAGSGHPHRHLIPSTLRFMDEAVLALAEREDVIPACYRAGGAAERGDAPATGPGAWMGA